MPDDASFLSSGHARRPDPAGAAPWTRAILARYRDALARGLAADAALREAAGLLWALHPALSPRQAEDLARDALPANRP